MEQNHTQVASGMSFKAPQDTVKLREKRGNGKHRAGNKEKVINYDVLSIDTAKKMINKFLYGTIVSCYSKRYWLCGRVRNKVKHLALYLGVREKGIYRVLTLKEDDCFDIAKKTMRIRLKINSRLINLFLMTKFKEDINNDKQ